MKKNNLLSLLLIGSIVLSVSLVSCNKDNDEDEDPEYLQYKGEFKDSRDSKTYKWIKIGEQVWMAENLAYAGSNIQHITDDNEWEDNIDYDGWCYYNNHADYGNTYGVLYQWESAKSICPNGWHLPTGAEWTQLENYLNENGYSYDGVIGNNNIAKSLANNSGWSISKYQGAVGNSDFPEFQNKTGFSALPSGARSEDGDFGGLGNYGLWWSATEFNNHHACTNYLYYHGVIINRYDDFYKSSGVSVRCVRD